MAQSFGNKSLAAEVFDLVMNFMCLRCYGHQENCFWYLVGYIFKLVNQCSHDSSHIRTLSFVYYNE